MDLIVYTLRSLAYVIVEPTLIIMLILLGLVFYNKNRKLVMMQKMIIGEGVNSPIELTLSQIVLGIFAGIFASLILSHLGVMFDENSGIEFLFMISIILTFIKPRLVCFSYSGAILGFISLIFTYFNIKTSNSISLFTLDITMLMTFVGVIHIVEGILVMFDGARGAVPVFSNRNGKIMGGYALRRYWLIPIAIFIAYNSVSSSSVVTESIGTPEWWPILKGNNVTSIIESAILSLIPLIGILGYSSVTFTRRKRQKSISSGLFIIAYGIILSLVAQVADFNLVCKIVVLIFAPAAHELMLYIQRIEEERRSPMFVSDEEGLSVLETVPYSKAYDLGIKPGDKIVLVNNKMINNEADIYVLLKENLNNITMTVKDKSGNTKEFLIKHEFNKRFGVILVPRSVDMGKVVSFENQKFSEVLKNIKDKK